MHKANVIYLLDKLGNEWSLAILLHCTGFSHETIFSDIETEHWGVANFENWEYSLIAEHMKLVVSLVPVVEAASFTMQAVTHFAFRWLHY